MANKVSLSLPPQSMQWGRSVEERLREIERVASNLNTSVASANASLSAVLKANREINNQVAFLATRTEFLASDNNRGWTSPSDGASYTFHSTPYKTLQGHSLHRLQGEY